MTLLPQATRSVSALREVQIELTELCDADCEFCINRASFAKFGRHNSGLSTETLIDVLDWLALSGVKRVRFTGGEPLLRKDVGVLAAHAKSKGLIVGLNTNGYLVEQRVRDLEYFDFILISVASADPATTDLIFRHHGSHRQKLKALTLLSSHPNLWVSTVLTPQSISELESIGRLLARYEVSRWILLRPEPNGSNVTLTLPDLKHALSVIRRMTPSLNFTIALGNAVPLCAEVDPADRDVLRRLLLEGEGGVVSEGRSKLVINPSGQVLVHYGVDDAVGMILGDLEEALAHPTSQSFRAIAGLPRLCLTCADLSICGGGSRLAALAAKELGSAADPLMTSVNGVDSHDIVTS